MSLSYLLEPLLAGLLLFFAAWSAGIRWAVHARVAVSATGEWSLATALGLALLGIGGYFLGAFGALRPVPVSALAIALALPGLPTVRERLTSLGRPRGVGWILGAVAAAGVALALYPPLAFDETLYHLPMARAYARTGAMPFLPDIRLPVCPALFEVLAAEVLPFGGDLATHLLSWLSVTATAALLVDWGQRRGPLAAGHWAAALYVGSPLVAYLAGTAYVEPLLTLFATAALSVLDAWRRRRELRVIIPAALLAGACASTKYLGLFVAAAVVAALAWVAMREGRWRQAVLGGAVLAAVVALPYGRILLWTGNPLFPFLSSIFGSSEWMQAPHEPVAERLVGWLRAPFDALFARARVGGLPPISPAYLLALPLIVLVGSRWSRAVLAMTTLYAALLPLHVRYLLPLAPVLALAAASDAAGDRRTAWLARGRWRGLVTVLLLLPSLVWAAHRLIRLGPLPASVEMRERFLAERVPGFDGLAFLNRAHGARYTVYAAHAEHLHDYARGRFLGDWSGPHAFAKVLGTTPTSEALHARLSQAGADYLLVPAVPSVAAIEALARGGNRFREVFRSDTATVYAVLREPDSVPRRWPLRRLMAPALDVK